MVPALPDRWGKGVLEGLKMGIVDVGRWFVDGKVVMLWCWLCLGRGKVEIAALLDASTLP